MGRLDGKVALAFRSRGYEAMALSGNALVEEDVAASVDLVTDEYRRLDIAVNMIGMIYWSLVADAD